MSAENNYTVQRRFGFFWRGICTSEVGGKEVVMWVGKTRFHEDDAWEDVVQFVMTLVGDPD